MSKQSTGHPRELFPAQDRGWADRALLQLIRADVARAQVDAALAEAAAACEGVGGRAEDVHGTADAWASARVAEWRRDGDIVWAAEAPLDVRSALVSTFWLAAGLALLFGLSDAMRDRTVEPTWGYLLLPTLLALACVTVYAAYQRTLRAHSRAVASAVGVAVAVCAACGVAALTWATRDHEPFEAGWRIVAGQALGNAVVALLLAKVLPQRQPIGKTPVGEIGAGPMSDDRWLADCGLALRRESGQSEEWVRARLHEATVHAHAAGGTLWDEFGPPMAYAAGLPRRGTSLLAKSVRNRAVFGLSWLLLGLSAVLRDGDVGFLVVGAVSVGLLLVADAVISSVRARRQSISAHPARPGVE